MGSEMSFMYKCHADDATIVPVEHVGFNTVNTTHTIQTENVDCLEFLKNTTRYHVGCM